MRVSSIPTVSKMIGMLPYKEELRKKMVTDRIKDRISNRQTIGETSPSDTPTK